MNPTWQDMSVAELAADHQIAMSVSGMELPEDLLEATKKDPGLAERVHEAQTLLQTLPAQLLKASKPTSAQVIDTTWQAIQAATQQHQPSKVVQLAPRRRAKIRNLFLGAVAAAAMLIAGIFVFSNDNQVFEANGTELVDATLPDGSIVTLTPGSKLTVFSYEKERLMSLEGEAFFEVEKGNRFSVSTPEGTIEVLGTSFNIDARNSGLTVACATGRVAVKRGVDEAILTKGNQVSNLAQGLTAVSEIDVSTIAGYRSFEISYTNQSLRDIVEDVNRFYNIKVDLSEDQLQRKFNVSLPTKDIMQLKSKLEFLLNEPLELSSGVLRQKK